MQANQLHEAITTLERNLTALTARYIVHPADGSSAELFTEIERTLDQLYRLTGDEIYRRIT